ncbi:MBL fold metallo-hydrolase [Corallococcus llansteffanensis]|uniref:MBL fold metallo-hydrolase n=1 Tax=Corallococcus llansteffanensis TaxID=2316731 RepID=A0A3A8PXU5_9BACT|nr:MBL fold metallo-hydrolase [Corallococcus llansteffanensis]RKH57242.1 MBL fold metallo-hydrolase [Corallococcus llansteffanensis]
MRSVLPPIVAVLLLTFSASASEDPGRARVRAAAEAMGGEARLRALSSLRIQGVGHWNLQEQGERPAPPYRVMYEQFDELSDLRRGHLRQKNEARGAVLPDWKSLTMLLSQGVVAVEYEGKLRPAGAAQFQDLRERLDLAPEHVLLAALDAADLKAQADTVLQEVPHHVVTFSVHGASVRLFLNARTALPTRVETVDAHPEDPFWSIWGDVRTGLSFQAWSLEPGGLRYPRQWDWERQGQTYHSLTLTAVTVDPPFTDADFAVPEDVKQGFEARRARKLEDAPVTRPDAPPVELAPGVVQLTGPGSVVLVAQDDGVVVLEAPLAAGYSGRVLEEAAKRFPSLKVKAVVSTSDAWPHIGGLREYVARGIPVYVLDVNRALVEELVRAPRTRLPDALALKPRAAKLTGVGQRQVLGMGKKRLELIPARTETGERRLFVWLPEERLLYTSDQVKSQLDGAFINVQQVDESVEVTRREKLEVTRVFGMGLKPTEFGALTTAVDRARAPVAR